MQKCKIFIFIFLYLIITNKIFSQENQIIIQGSHFKEIYDLAFSPNEKLIASISLDNILIVWDIEKKYQIVCSNLPFCGELTFFEDDAILITNNLNYSILFNINNLEIIENAFEDVLIDNSTNSKYFSEDNSVFVRITDFKLQKFTQKGDIYKRNFQKSTLIHDYFYTSLAVAEKRNLIFAADESGKIYKYQFDTGNFKGYFHNTDTMICYLKLSANQNFLATVDIENTIKIYNIGDFSEISNLKPLVYKKTTVAINNYDNKIIFGDENGLLYLFDINEQNIDFEVIDLHNSLISDIEIFKNDYKIFTASWDNHAKIFDYKNDKILYDVKAKKNDPDISENQPKPYIKDLAISPNEKFAAFVGKRAKIIDLENFNSYKIKKCKYKDKIKIYYSNAIEVNHSFHTAMQLRFEEYPTKVKRNKFYHGLIDIDTSVTCSSDPSTSSCSETYTYYPWFGEVTDFHIETDNSFAIFCTNEVFGKTDFFNENAYVCEIPGSLIQYNSTNQNVYVASEKNVYEFNIDELSDKNYVKKSFYTDDDYNKINIITFNFIDNKSYENHTGNITGFSFDFKNNLMATSSEDGSVNLWNVENNELIVKIIASKDGVVLIDKNGNFTGTENSLKNIIIKSGTDYYKANISSDLYREPKIFIENLNFDF